MSGWSMSTRRAVSTSICIGASLCAMLARLMSTALYRMPMVLSPQTFAFAFIVIAAAVVLAGVLIQRRLYHLVGVLKTGE